MSDREITGGNNPPDMAITVGEVTKDLSDYMAENPVVETDEQARESKLFIDRATLAIADLEAERKGINRPFEEKVKANNDHYRGPRSLLEGVLSELKSRFDTFLRGEEDKRRRVAVEAQRIADEAERIARSAEDREKRQIENSLSGELGVDIAGAITEADQRFAEFTKAAHQAAIAERETKVRIGGGFRRALSLRDKDTIVVEDPIEAIKDIGLTNEIILEAIRKSARAYKKVFGRFPKGITVYTERKS
jgi:hypothetical protein